MRVQYLSAFDTCVVVVSPTLHVWCAKTGSVTITLVFFFEIRSMEVLGAVFAGSFSWI